jgi:hypothetical protein
MAIHHKQINSFGFGNVEQLTNDITTEEAPLYPRMFVLPSDTLFDQNQLTYNFQIIVADILEQDYSNQRDVLNDTLEIIKDIFTRLYLSDYESEWGASVEPFLERFEDVLCGWTLTFQLTQPFDYNRCVLPERPFIPLGKKWFELAEKWNEISKEWKDV